MSTADRLKFAVAFLERAFLVELHHQFSAVLLHIHSSYISRSQASKISFLVL